MSPINMPDKRDPVPDAAGRLRFPVWRTSPFPEPAGQKPVADGPYAPAPQQQLQHAGCCSRGVGAVVPVRRRHAGGPAAAGRSSPRGKRPAAWPARTISSRSLWPCTITTTFTGAFPAAYVADENGRPMHSWRVALLPFLEQSDLYSQYNFNEPWDSPENLRWPSRCQRPIAVRRRPASAGQQPDQLRGHRRRSGRNRRRSPCFCRITGRRYPMSSTGQQYAAGRGDRPCLFPGPAPMRTPPSTS